MSDIAKRICDSVRIADLYQSLTGTVPKRIRGEMYRGPATWRSGDNPNAVSLDNDRGIWHDFVTDQGGGILQLVMTCKGGTKADALKTVAEFAGVPLNQPEWDEPKEIERWKEHKRLLASELQVASWWKRGITKLLNELLDELKAPLLDSSKPFPALSEIFDTTKDLRRLQAVDGLELISEYHSFLELQPGYTAALVRWAKDREQQERRAVLSFLGLR